jgi:DNA polymerase III sliding clamp (beta) subunit (PCNA family)
MNAKYLQSDLDSLGGKTVRVRYHDAVLPIAFIDRADPSRTQIVMALWV